MLEMKPFEYLEHTADVKFLARGLTPEEMFRNAALAMFNTMTDTSKVQAQETWNLELEAENLELLLYDWLSELLYLFEVDLALFCAFDLNLGQNENGYRLEAQIQGERIDRERHVFENEVKAITLHQFKIEKKKFWIAQVVLDV
ncbi:MAG: archease [Methanotrichaceae archaeon]